MHEQNILKEILTVGELELLCNAYGGADLYIPNPGSTALIAAIAERIGQAAVDKLVAWARGSKIYIPRNLSNAVDRRHLDVRIMHKSGMKITEIARAYEFTSRYSERQISNIISEGRDHEHH